MEGSYGVTPLGVHKLVCVLPVWSTCRCDLDGNGRIEREELRTLLYHLPSRLWRFSTGTIKKEAKKPPALLSVPGEDENARREGRRRTVPPTLDTSPIRSDGRKNVVHFAGNFFDSSEEDQEESEEEEEEEDDEKGDALVFDARDQLVRRRIDEIVEAAFQCKHKTRSSVRAATVPPRNLWSSESWGKVDGEAEGRKAGEGDCRPPAVSRRGDESRRGISCGRPARGDEGLTFEEFLSSLDSNREILDVS